MTNKIQCLLMGVMILNPSFAYPQERKQNETATKLEQFLSKKGSLVIRDTYAVGTLSGLATSMTIEALILYEPGKELSKIRGFRVEVQGGGRLERSNTSFLDMDEVESLSKAVSYIIDLLEKWKGTTREYTEVYFATKGDFKLGFYQKGATVQAFASSGTIGVATAFFSTSDFARLRSLIDSGLIRLKD